MARRASNFVVTGLGGLRAALGSLRRARCRGGDRAGAPDAPLPEVRGNRRYRDACVHHALRWAFGQHLQHGRLALERRDAGLRRDPVLESTGRVFAFDDLVPGRSFSLGFALRAAVLVLFAFMPLFNFFGLWDSYLSSSLYSGASKRAYVLEWDGSQWQTTRIGDLSEGELNAPAYPEERIFKNVFAGRMV